MRLLVAGIGQRMPGWVSDGWNEYARRMPREMPLELKELPLGQRGKNPDIARIRQRESESLLAAVPGGYQVVALDQQGAQWSTRKLADNMERWMSEGQNYCFLIGGPDGLDRACLEKASSCWSLGSLTLPHPLVRVILAEQVYRAWTIIQNHPYHRA